MRSIIEVTVPATDASILTIDELRAATGTRDSSKDAILVALGATLDERIADICAVRGDGINPPTLRKETIVETFFGNRHFTSNDGRVHIGSGGVSDNLVLSRRPIVSIAGFTSDGTDIDTSDDGDLIVDRRPGIIGRNLCWAAWGNKIIITYDAGYTTVPGSLKLAAMKLAKLYFEGQTRDTGLRAITIPDVVEKMYWVGQITNQDVPQDILDILAPYVNELGGVA